MERFLSLFTTLRAGEGAVAAQLCLQSFAIMFSYYTLKVIREPMILADGSAELKAYSSAAQAILLMLIVPLFARLYQRTSVLQEKHHLFRNSLLFFIINLLAFGFCYQQGWPIAIAFYIWLGIFAVMVLALFWAFAADLFNPRSGQRIFPLIAAAGALGALFGAGMASPIDIIVGHDGLMFCAALLLVLPWWLSRSSENSVPPGSRCYAVEVKPEAPSPLLQGFQIVWQSRYLSLIAIFVILLNLINANGEYILASFVTEHAKNLGATGGAGMQAENYITQFYSRYVFATTGLSFLIQLFLVSRIYDRVGISGALYILPILMLVNYSLLALFPIMAVARAALIAENSVGYSLQNTTRHALFLPVNRREKYVGKHTIDTFFFRVGDVLSGSFIFIASTVISLGIVGFVLVNCGLAALLFWVSRAIGRRHTNAAREVLGNMPPIAGEPPKDLHIPAGQVSHLQLGADTFTDPDVGDALKYQAFDGDARRLPHWIKFDTYNQTFRFCPPPRSSGSMVIRVRAQDFDGLDAEVSFTLDYGVN